MKKIMISIPTYNRKNAIEEWFSNCRLQDEENIYITIHDSSTDGETQKYYECEIKGKYKNVYYKQYDSSIDGNLKSILIYEEFGYTDMDYVWLINDHTLFSREAIEIVKDELEKDYSFYLLDLYANMLENYDLENGNDFLEFGVWRLSKYGTAIINRNELVNFDFEKFRTKYGGLDTISFIHEALFFEMAANSEQFNIKVLSFKPDYFKNLIINNKGRRGWYKETMVVVDRWITMINKLPPIYTNKTECYKQIEREWISKYSVLEYKSEGVYGLKDYFKYKKWLKEYGNLKTYFLISILPLNIARSFVYSNIKNEIKQSKNEQREIVIYGAGSYGKKCYRLLKNNNINVNAFIVQNSDKNVENVNGVKVYSAEEFLKGRKAIILLALGVYNLETVYKYLNGIKEKNNNVDFIIKYFFEE